jgi:hypothetical protein
MWLYDLFGGLKTGDISGINNAKVLLAEWYTHVLFSPLPHGHSMRVCVSDIHRWIHRGRRKADASAAALWRRVDHVIPFASSSSCCTTTFRSGDILPKLVHVFSLFPFFYFLILQMDITWDNGDRPRTGRADLSYRRRAGCWLCYSRRCWPTEQNPGACKGYDLPFLMHVTALFDILCGRDLFGVFI